MGLPRQKVSHVGQILSSLYGHGLLPACHNRSSSCRVPGRHKAVGKDVLAGKRPEVWVSDPACGAVRTCKPVSPTTRSDSRVHPYCLRPSKVPPSGFVSSAWSNRSLIARIKPQPATARNVGALHRVHSTDPHRYRPEDSDRSIGPGLSHNLNPDAGRKVGWEPAENGCTYLSSCSGNEHGTDLDSGDSFRSLARNIAAS